MKKKSLINIPMAVIGAVAAIIGGYYLSAIFDLEAENKIQGMIDRVNHIKADPFHFYFSKITVPFMIFALAAYAVYLIYKISMRMNRMPGKEYGTSKLESPFYVTKRLADLSKDENDPLNVVVYREKYGVLERIKMKWKHRKDD